MQTNVFISPNALLLECIIRPSGGTTIQKNPFGTQQQLENRKIIGIETVSVQDVAFSPISTSNPNIPASVFAVSFLSLYTTSVFERDPRFPEDKTKSRLVRPEGLFYDQIPLPLLRRVNNYDNTPVNQTSGGRDIFRVRPTELSWTKCYVSIPQSVTITTTYSALFIVHYLDIGDEGLKYF